jgi:WD40 repeat protein
VILRGHDGPVFAVAISPNSHWLVTGYGEENTARLWDLSAKDPGANPVVLRGPEDVVSVVAISPDNRWLVTGSRDGTARLWDLEVKDFSANPLVLHSDEWIWHVGISPGNRWLVTVSSHDTARLWLLQVNELIRLAGRTAGRNLTKDEWKLYFAGEKYRKTFDELPSPDESVTPKNN